MKATTITMQIVKNLGNFEMVRMEATYTLTDMEADHIEDSFVNARGQLEMAFKKAYNKTELERVEKDSTAKVVITDKKPMKRVLNAVKNGRLSIEDVRNQFEMTDELKDFFRVYGVEL